ncbi:MAG TPA: MbnH family di-heme enzyme [Candidatus Polarisedimenticolaceae bacterium]|nr:MbnH family di-heme enzyme [Candidatus Polarisedimenticolaceae bacterium]
MRRAGSQPLVVVVLVVAASVADGAEFAWRLPRGFPVPLVPAHNPMSEAKVELGRRLFHDARLSPNGTTACATCHRPELAFTDGKARAVGATGETHPRGAMSLANVAYNASLNWADPDVRTLERQAHGPMFNDAPIEMGIAGNEQVILARLRLDARYPALFAAAFGAGETITLDNVARAIASFERTLISGDSPYDRWVYHGETDGIDEATRRGMRLFFSDRLRCAECHGGFNFGGPVVFEGSADVAPTFHNTGLYDVDGRGAYPADNPGLYAATGDRRDMGRFKAPTLRNVAVTAPYMHDGSIGTLAGVIEFYAAGGREVDAGPDAGDGRANQNKSELIGGFALTTAERDDLLRFLDSLTDRRFLADPAHRRPAGD